MALPPGLARHSTALALGLLLLALPVLAGGWLGYVGGPGHGHADDWIELGSPPGGLERYPPQGLTLADGQLVFSEHWNDTRSVLYLVEPQGMVVRAQASMPTRAVHTSGLAWDGETLWAVDHASCELFALDLQATFAEGAAQVRRAWPTGLGGPSAMTVLRVDGVVYLAISDFMHSGRTYLVARDRVPELNGLSLPEIAHVSYANGTFSQGLTWDGRHLLEAVNNRGVDRIEVYDVVSAVREGDGGLVRLLGSFSAPGSAVEDLATDGQQLWTSDEKSYRWYRLPDLPGMIARVLEDPQRSP